MTVTRASAAIPKPDVVMTMEVAPHALIGVKATPAVEMDPVGVMLVSK